MNRLLSKIALLFWGLLQFAPLHASDRIISIYGQPADSLLIEHFDYSSYAALIDQADAALFKADFAYLDSSIQQPNEFFKRAFASYFEQYPIGADSPEELLRRVLLGEALLNERAIALQMQGDRILQKATEAIELHLQEEEWEYESEPVKELVAVLKRNQFLVDPPPPSDLEKLKRNLKEGNYTYVSNRLYSRCVVDCSTGDCGRSCLAVYVAAAILIFGSLFFVGVKLKRAFAS